jgi:hypothetical protein
MSKPHAKRHRPSQLTREQDVGARKRPGHTRAICADVGRWPTSHGRGSWFVFQLEKPASRPGGKPACISGPQWLETSTSETSFSTRLRPACFAR